MCTGITKPDAKEECKLSSLSSSIDAMAHITPTPRKILLFGATGTIGKYICSELIRARTSFDKIGVFTSPSTAANKSGEINSWKKQGIEVIVGDVNSEEDLAKAYEGTLSPCRYRKSKSCSRKKCFTRLTVFPQRL